MKNTFQEYYARNDDKGHKTKSKQNRKANRNAKSKEKMPTNADYLNKMYPYNFKYCTNTLVEIKIGEDTYYIPFNLNDERLSDIQSKFLKSKFSQKSN